MYAAGVRRSSRAGPVLDGAVRVYRDGREVCQKSKAGDTEYLRRVKVMWQRAGEALLPL